MKRLLLLLVIAACVPAINKVLYPAQDEKLAWYYEACLADAINPLKPMMTATRYGRCT